MKGSTPECCIEGCELLARNQGLCEMHDSRRRKHGDPNWTPPDLAQRFWAKVDRCGPEECWEWLGYKVSTGYGRFGMGGKRGKVATAHRVAYELQIGPVPEGLEIDHLCRNRGCMNGAHLEAVTHGENLRRRYAARRMQ